MNNKNIALRVSGTIFMAVALAHLLRLLLRLPVTVGSFSMRLYLSLACFVAAFLLSIWMFYASGKK